MKKEKKAEYKIPCECYSRIVGYFRPVNCWNPGKQEEFKDRLEYKVDHLHDLLLKEDK